MKRACFLILYLLLAAYSFCHPGVGIVKDSKGNIYYTDLKQVWKIDKDGKKSVVVPNVHTHELYVDGNDELYGEHLWYNGERLDTWGHYAWRLRKSGKLDTVVGPAEGFLTNYSFNRDSLGNHYWAERWKISRIKKKTPSGEIVTLAEGKFRDIRWMHVTPDGVVYFVDLVDLYRIDKSGQMKLLAKSLSQDVPPSRQHTIRHAVMGIWLDKENNVYVAVNRENAVKKITPEGKVSSIVKSPALWSPSGGLFDDEGNLWLLESSSINQVRVRKIMPAERQNSITKTSNLKRYLLPASLAAVCLLSIGAVKWINKRKKAQITG